MNDHAQCFEDSREIPNPKSASTTSALKQNRFQQGKPKSNEGGGLSTQPPTKTIPNSGAVPRQATGDQPSVDYKNADALLMLQNFSPHGHLQQSGLVENQHMSVFIDSDASFNAVYPQFAARVGLKVFDHARPLTIRLGAGKQAVIPRRVTSLSIILPDFSIYTSGAFVMDIPESCEVMLGMPWLKDINPIIDWTAKTVRSRPDVQPAVRGTTRLVRPRDLTKLLRAADNEFCFLINSSDASGMSEKRAAAWKAMESMAVYPLLLEFRDVVFRSELPSVPPTRQNMDANIEVSDSTPVHRKQSPFLKEQREPILQWTRKMLKAKLIRPSSSPYYAPTFCVQIANGEWRIVHDFSDLNAKVRVPVNPIPRTDEILRAMARGKVFSALDLLWGFFQVKLREYSNPYTAFSAQTGFTNIW
ncbi:unnamed protein product [Phytophthora fragariaefolia]|uniref:Unnamed protein product n=1 Tax=Phytophthora fragariaefolia TaxID=1490495 RepID=A0A9W6WW52_9STRA|nr:unnamed protein product [Phytophthora fragariaefolia]